MIAKCASLFFSTVIIVASALILLNHPPESIFFLGLAGMFGTPFFRRLNLGWVLQIGSLGTVGALSISSTPANCMLSLALGFSQAYLLGLNVLKYFFDIDIDNPKKVKSEIKAKVEEVKTCEVPKSKLGVTIDPVLIDVEPAGFYARPNFKHPVLLSDTLRTLKYAKFLFSLDDVDCKKRLTR